MRSWTASGHAQCREALLRRSTGDVGWTRGGQTGYDGTMFIETDELLAPALQCYCHLSHTVDSLSLTSLKLPMAPSVQMRQVSNINCPHSCS